MKFDLIQYQQTEPADKTHFYYKGLFAPVVLSALGKHINYIFNERPKLGRRLFAIFIEVAQNIAYYSAERASTEARSGGIGSLLIFENNVDLIIVSANPISKENAKKITDRDVLIRKYSLENLRSLKRQMRTLSHETNHTGGNIGLIQVALKARRFPEVEVIKHGEESILLITTKIPK